MKTYEQIIATEYSKEFDKKRKDAMVMGHYKYGSVRENREAKATDMVESMRIRIDKYVATGNTEFLCDIANFAMIEYMVPLHPNAHYRATDSGESPGLAGMSVGEIKRFMENNA
jgi:hypothetical protein